MLHRTIQGNEGNTSTETDMAKGRPKQEERLRAVEELLMANNSVNRQDTARIAALEARMADLEFKLKDRTSYASGSSEINMRLKQQLIDAVDRMTPTQLEEHLKGVTRGGLYNDIYKPLFDRWPGNGS